MKIFPFLFAYIKYNLYICSMEKVIDNFELIKPLLEFGQSEGDEYYVIFILKRRKDNPDMSSSLKIIKDYYITSLEYLESKKEEIIKLCKVFNARAVINLNRKSYKDTAFVMLEKLASALSEEKYQGVRNLYRKSSGNTKIAGDKRWVVDIDEKLSEERIKQFCTFIHRLRPEGKKEIALLPSKNGWHVITTPFDLKVFNEQDVFNFEIKKDNPTNLYIPK